MKVLLAKDMLTTCHPIAWSCCVVVACLLWGPCSIPPPPPPPQVVLVRVCVLGCTLNRTTTHSKSTPHQRSTGSRWTRWYCKCWAWRWETPDSEYSEHCSMQHTINVDIRTECTYCKYICIHKYILYILLCIVIKYLFETTCHLY